MRTFLSFDAKDENGLQFEKNGQHKRLTLNILSVLVNYAPRCLLNFKDF